MSKLAFFVSVYVAIFAAGQPGWTSPQNQAPDAPQEKVQVPLSVPGEDLSVSPPPPLPEHPPPPEAHYYTYQQQLTVRAGANGLLPQDQFENKVIGFQYLFPKFLSPKLEAGADVQSGGNGHLHAGVRWIYWERSYFRPSLKVGVDHLVTSSEGLASFTHYQNYYLRASSTLEYVVWDPYSVRLEAELLVGFNNVLDEVTLGLSRGW